MPRGNARRDLYLQVSGDIGGLRTAMTAGKSIINDFGGSAINIIEEVEREMAALGASGLPALKQTERAYQDTFRRIADSAREAANSPSDQGAAQILNANAAREAAAAATSEAQALRVLAEAAQRADASTEGGTAATRAYAVAAAAAAVNAEREAEALRDQAGVLGLVERQMGTAAIAQRRNVTVSGEARAGYQQLSYQLGDIATQYASGTAMSLIFAQQSSQVIQAIGLINREATGLIGFLSGPWGIALTSALVVLTPWVAKLLEGNDALGDGIEKLKSDALEAETARRAHEAFSQTIEGQIAAQRRLNDELDRSIRTQRQVAQERVRDAQGNLEAQRRSQADLQKRIADQQRIVDISRRQIQSPAFGSAPQEITAVAAAAQAVEDLKALQAQMNALNISVGRGEQAVREAQQSIIQSEVAATFDKNAAAALRYEIALGRLNQQQAIGAGQRATVDFRNPDGSFTRGQLDGISNERYRSEVARIGRERDAAIEAQQDRQSALRRSTSDARSGRLTPTEVGEMLTQRWGGSFSGSRSAESNRRVGGVANSRHLRDQAVDFVPAGGMGSVSQDEIRAYLQSQGVNIEELLGPGDRGHNDHFHVGFSRARRTPEAINRSAERAEDRETQNGDAYASLLSRAREQQLRIEQSRLVTISELAENDRRQVDLAREDIDRAARKGVELERWTQAEADAVLIITERNAREAKAAIDDRERIALRQQAIDSEIAQLDGQAELLQLQGQLAGTARDRRRIALELLDIETRQARQQIQRQLEGERDPQRRAQLADELGYVNRNAAVRRAVAERQNASPIEAYRQELADFDVEDELETAEVRFFDNLNDQLADSATEFVRLKGVAGDFFNQLIADVIRLQIQQAVTGGGSGGLIGGFLRLTGQAGNGLRGVTAESSFAIADQAAAIDARNLRGFSIGGWTGHGRGTAKGVVHGEEYIFDADSTARIGVGTLDALRAGTLTSRVPSMPSIGSAERALSSSGGLVRVEVVSGEMFDARVAGISGNVSAQVAASTAPAIVGAASNQATGTMVQRARRQMR